MRNSVELMDRIQHGDDVLHRRTGLQIVNRIEYEPAAGREDLAAAQYFLAHFLRRAERQGLLCIHAPAPEDQARAVLPLQPGRLHPGRRTLYRVDNVETGLDEAFEKPLHTAAGMFETFPASVAVHPVVDAFVIGKPEFAEGGDGAERRGLRAEIRSAEVDAIHRAGDAGVNSRQVPDADLALALENAMDVSAPSARRHVPLGDVAYAFRFFQKR